MKEYQKTSHSVWDCKYHIVFIPKYRQKKIYGELRKALREQFHKLSYHKESQIIEGYLMKDHVHMLISIPPKYSVAHVVGYIKGKTALYVAQHFGRRRKYRGYHFWARGYFVSTVGFNEEVVRRYIQNQEKSDKQVEQMSLFVEYSINRRDQPLLVVQAKRYRPPPLVEVIEFPKLHSAMLLDRVVAMLLATTGVSSYSKIKINFVETKIVKSIQAIFQVQY